MPTNAVTGKNFVINGTITQAHIDKNWCCWLATEHGNVEIQQRLFCSSGNSMLQLIIFTKVVMVLSSKVIKEARFGVIMEVKQPALDEQIQSAPTNIPNVSHTRYHPWCHSPETLRWWLLVAAPSILFLSLQASLILTLNTVVVPVIEDMENLKQEVDEHIREACNHLRFGRELHRKPVICEGSITS
ncbi:hypothetical protein M8C21_013789 [Ambrosia artemisiifolia]|uniref:Uncharacterized protein n=1 Tax=Ambrosia artemisiifolia TaxID=4212 RepID=A0AAD5C8K6_AMBAR|nr:hypothetical protein M8C21_013789 [Ambrosia artemisiifolia]